MMRLVPRPTSPSQFHPDPLQHPRPRAPFDREPWPPDGDRAGLGRWYQRRDVVAGSQSPGREPRGVEGEPSSAKVEVSKGGLALIIILGFCALKLAQKVRRPSPRQSLPSRFLYLLQGCETAAVSGRCGGSCCGRRRAESGSIAGPLRCGDWRGGRGKGTLCPGGQRGQLLDDLVGASKQGRRNDQT